MVTRSSTWRSWVTSTSPPRCTARRSSSQAMASMSRWLVGSSRISRTSSPASPGGPTSTSARARATRLASPPDSVRSPRRAGRPCRGGRGSAAASHPLADGVAHRGAGQRRLLVEHDDPGASAAPHDPGSRARPIPASWRSSVDFPLPLRPTTARRSPDPMVTDTSANSDAARAAGGQARGVEQDHQPEATGRRRATGTVAWPIGPRHRR